MALTAAGLASFMGVVVHLTSFPMFCAYVLVVALAGWWQRVSKPVSMRPVLIAYNFLCSALSAYTFFGFLYGIYASDHVFQKEASAPLRRVFFVYWVTKNVELLDTLIMVVRHRRRQISFLHVYHHASMVLLSDLAFHQYPWPCIAVYLCLNSLVHILLYFYYGLTALAPNSPPPWKQRLTEMQILQFFLDMIFHAVGYMHYGFCVYGMVYGFIMTWLFSNFYYHAYLKRRAPKSTLEKSQ